MPNSLYQRKKIEDTIFGKTAKMNMRSAVRNNWLLQLGETDKHSDEKTIHKEYFSTSEEREWLKYND